MTDRRDPLADRSAVLLWLFGWYLRWYFYRRFHAVRISRAGLPMPLAGRKLIIYSNHPSWWDPALFILIARRLLPERVGYGPMETAALRKYGLMRRMGVFAIDPSTSRGAAEFLRVSERVLNVPQGALWVTAEGSFTDNRLRPVVLRPGIAHLARRVPDVVLLPMAIEYVFWNESRPEALLRFGAPIEGSRAYDVASWTKLLSEALSGTMDKLAAESAARDATLFRSVVHGTRGVGGIYDLWRRVYAWACGRRFDSSHGDAHISTRTGRV